MTALVQMTHEDHQLIADVLKAEEAELSKDLDAAGGYKDAAHIAPELLDRLAAIRRVLRWW